MADAWAVEVTREPEWDSHYAGLVQGLAEYDQDVHDGCGLHRSVVEDPHFHYTFETDTCRVCAARAVYERQLAERDETWDEKHPKARPEVPRPSDGESIHIRPLTPAEVMKRQARTRRR